jgi:NADH-quinone oxidoreductase subunit G
MAAVASETVNLVINDVEIAVPKGELIVESVKRLGLEIPIFCYHPRMKPVGMCRMCLVEVGFKQPDGSVRKMPKPQAACTLPAQDNMVIFTDTEMVHRDRKGVLEFLLINHPLDCPICDRGGECPLQNNTLFYGPSTSRFIEVKRHAHKAFPLSKYVTLDLERCIQCGRCVRFTEEISGDSELAFRFRGASMQPSTFELRDFTSKFSGNVIEICPVGALTNREYRFRARPWDLETKPAICLECSNGCATWFDYRVSRLVRVNGRTNEAVNEEWTCDRGKFGHEHYNADNRLTVPLIRKGDRLEECDWPTAYAAILSAFGVGGDKVAMLAGSSLSNEGAYLLNRLFHRKFGSSNVDYRRTVNTLPPDEAAGNAPTAIADLELKPSILVFGNSPADDIPIIFLRIRKAWFKHGARVVVAHHGETEADSFADLVLRYAPGTDADLAKGLVAARANDAAGVAQAAAVCGVDEARIREAAALLGENTAIVTTDSLLNSASGADAFRALRQLGGELNRYALGANDQGFADLGLVPGPEGRGSAEILAGCADGSIESLWLAGADPFAFGDRATVEKVLEQVGFLVYQGTHKTEAVGYASVVLPMAEPAEGDGTYVNAERRLQELRAVISPPGEAKAAWRIGAELALRVGMAKPYFGAKDVAAEISTHVPAFRGAELGSRLS